MAVPFRPNSSIMICGPTGSGKTEWVKRLLYNLDSMYSSNPIKEVIYCFGVWQKTFEVLERELSFITFHEGLPDPEYLKNSGVHRLFVLDDLLQECVDSPDIRKIFTQGCHHNNLSVIFISQNLFQQGKNARTISLNCWYLVLFKNFRDIMQIKTLSRQSGLGKKLISAYTDAVSVPYGYLVVDFAPGVEDKYRLRSRVFPGEDSWIYV
jgi:GTPase SAR1 family protein